MQTLSTTQLIKIFNSHKTYIVICTNPITKKQILTTTNRPNLYSNYTKRTRIANNLQLKTLILSEIKRRPTPADKKTAAKIKKILTFQ